MIEILGRLTSSNVQAVMWGASEMGIDVTRFDYGGEFGGTTTDNYLKMNPMGLVPVLREGEFYMFESQSILRYLAAQFKAEQFWPSDLEKRAKIDQWMEWSKGTITPVLMYKVFWQSVRVSKKERDESIIKAGVAELNKTLLIADDILSTQDWIAGDKMTLADISFATPLFRYFSLEVEGRKEMTHLKEYYQRLCAREFYIKYVMVSYESLRHPEE